MSFVACLWLLVCLHSNPRLALAEHEANCEYFPARLAVNQSATQPAICYFWFAKKKKITDTSLWNIRISRQTAVPLSSPAPTLLFFAGAIFDMQKSDKCQVVPAGDSNEGEKNKIFGVMLTELCLNSRHRFIQQTLDSFRILTKRDGERRVHFSVHAKKKKEKKRETIHFYIVLPHIFAILVSMSFPLPCHYEAFI